MRDGIKISSLYIYTKKRDRKTGNMTNITEEIAIDNIS